MYRVSQGKFFFSSSDDATAQRRMEGRENREKMRREAKKSVFSVSPFSLSTVSFLLSLLRDTKTTLHFPPFHFFREHELLLRSIAGQFARSNTQAAEFRIHDHPRSPHFPKHLQCTKGYHAHLAVERIEIGPLLTSPRPTHSRIENEEEEEERKKTEQERKKEKGK